MQETEKHTLINYIQQKTPVIIHKTNERGFVEYSISPTIDTEFWINSFNTLDKAEKYCKRLELPIMEVRQ